MGILRAVEALAARHTGKLLRAAGRPVAHRRHARILSAGEAPADVAARARSTWWGAESRWYAAGTPPRRHTRVTPLIDGETYLRALQEALGSAEQYVYIAGWCLTPHIPLTRGAVDVVVDTRLLSLLDAVSQRVPVRVLLWSGAPAFIQPTTRAVRDVQRQLLAQSTGDLRCELDHTAHFSHCHHQKAIVVDGRLAFVGGMDLTTFQGDRWDSTGHPLRAGLNWHDVQLRIEGEAVADVEANFHQRWEAVTGERDLPRTAPVADQSWTSTTQIVRTIPQATYDFAPRGEFGIFHVYCALLRRAERLIYLENQYLWAPEIVDTLIEALNRPRTTPFRIVIVLPARAYSGKWDNDRHVEQLREADNGRNIIQVYAPYAWGPNLGTQPFSYRPIYVHAKVAVIDDEWLLVGSANLNDRGFVTDSEINALTHDPATARDLRIDLWTEHLGMQREEVAAADPHTLIDSVWREHATANARTIQRGIRPLSGTLHHYKTGNMPGSWLLEEVEMLTFEH